MKHLACRCGRPVFFDNHSCGNCGRRLAFDPGTLTMLAEEQPGSGLAFCANRDSASRCNWLAPSGSNNGGTCLSCRTSEIIPALSKPGNRDRWRKLELAKRRLIYDLLRLGLPVDDSELRFVFKEDRRSNPDVHDDHVSIGHFAGVITINAAEADDVYREQMRQQMNEPYRTLLGHFRHESGHYYFDVILDDERRGRARSLFGDESERYDEALQNYYRDGPRPGWEDRFISGYASAHPAEDWAECWAHYLHICAVLEVAGAAGLRTSVEAGSWQTEFIELVIAVNEVLRSMGLPDAYPFVITREIAAKIAFVHEAVCRFTNRPDGPWSAAP
jgi:hypothetical protein